MLWGALAILAITALRVALLALAEAELFVDEAQYWFWGQTLEFGYYSKPPLIGWIIRAVTELAGSDAAFWVRLPAPLLHGLTAWLLMLTAATFTTGWVPALVGLAYLTMPGIAVGSLLFSTDTVMLPFYAGALLLYLRLVRAPSAGTALAMGALLGLGVLGKYAALYFVLGAALAALFVRAARISWRHAALAALACVVVVSPNIWWNVANGLTTIEHTMDNVDWVRSDGVAAQNPLNWSGLGEFVAGQFAFFGPVLFGAWLILLVPVLRRGTGRQRLFVWMSLPVVLLVCGQALASRAYANWAAVAYVSGSLLVVPLLAEHARRWLILSFVINGALAIALPLAVTQASRLSLDGERLLLGRYIGRAALSEAVLTTAREHRLGMVVAANRDVLADLFYRAEGQGVEIRSVPPRGRAMNHYAQNHPLGPLAEGAVLYVNEGALPEGCEGPVLGRHAPEQGAYRGRSFTFWSVPAECLR